MDEAKHFGKRVAKLRKSRGLSQIEFASLAPCSQATVSRIEAAAEPPADVQLLSKLARALNISLVELLDGFDSPSALQDGAFLFFYAFCPNPLCETNKVGRDESNVLVVNWASSGRFEASLFPEINFCRLCATPLVKECPSCKKVLRNVNTRYCVTCGAKVCERPTADEWKHLNDKYPARSADDDIPF